MCSYHCKTFSYTVTVLSYDRALSWTCIPEYKLIQKIKIKINTSCAGEDASGGTVPDGLIDTPVLVRWGGRRNGAIQFPVSANRDILESEGVQCLHPGDGSSELSGISATERQLAILHRRSGRRFKSHGKEVGGDSPL
jgi:hypothetical protein